MRTSQSNRELIRGLIDREHLSGEEGDGKKLSGKNSDKLVSSACGCHC